MLRKLHKIRIFRIFPAEMAGGKLSYVRWNDMTAAVQFTAAATVAVKIGNQGRGQDLRGVYNPHPQPLSLRARGAIWKVMRMRRAPSL